MPMRNLSVAQLNAITSLGHERFRIFLGQTYRTPAGGTVTGLGIFVFGGVRLSMFTGIEAAQG